MTNWWFEILGVTAPWLMFTSAANLRIWWEVFLCSHLLPESPKNTSCWQIASPHRVYLYSFICIVLDVCPSLMEMRLNFLSRGTVFFYYRQVAVDKNCAQVTWRGTFLIVVFFFCNTQTEMNACSLKSCDIKYLTFFFLSCFFYTEQN